MTHSTAHRVLHPLFWALLVLGFAGCGAPAAETPEAFVQRFADRMAEATGVHYTIDYGIKFFSDSDTTRIFGECYMVRDTTDSIFGGHLWIEADSLVRYYDTRHAYLINHRDSTITRFFPHDGHDWVITGNTAGDLIETYFFNPQGVEKLINDSGAVSSVGDTTIAGVKLRKLAIAFPDSDDGYITHQRKVWVTNEAGELVEIRYDVKFQHEWQANRWRIRAASFGAVTPNDLQARFTALTELYPVTDYVDRPADELLPLANGALAPDFRGLHLMTGDSVSLADLRKRVTVLDFWYKDCFPCIKAIPALNAFRAKYSKKDVAIVGINPIDTDSLGRAQLPAFFESNPVSYDAVLTNRKQAADYKVQGYPTFFLLDRDGRIVHSQVGYSDQAKAKLDSLIQVLLSDG